MSNPRAWAGGKHVTIPAGAEIPVHYPASTVSGMQDGYMTAANFLKTLTDEDTALNAADVALSARIDTLEDTGTKTRSVTMNASFTFNQPADSEIYKVFIIWKSGTPNIAFGSTAGGTDIIDTVTLSSSNKFSIASISEYSIAGRTIYVTITGGTVDIIRYFIKNINT